MQDEGKTFTVSVDGDPVLIPRKNVTPNDILRAANLDPATRYLIELKGSNKIPHQDNADTEIHVHENQNFITGRRGPVTVS